jgi:hypothetical protein
MSRKPEFFSYNMPLYEVVTPDGLMRPVLAAKRGGLYCGGSARQVRSALRCGCWCVFVSGSAHTCCGSYVVGVGVGAMVVASAFERSHV